MIENHFQVQLMPCSTLCCSQNLDKLHFIHIFWETVNEYDKMQHVSRVWN